MLNKKQIYWEFKPPHGVAFIMQADGSARLAFPLDKSKEMLKWLAETLKLCKHNTDIIEKHILSQKEPEGCKHPKDRRYPDPEKGTVICLDCKTDLNTPKPTEQPNS